MLKKRKEKKVPEAQLKFLKIIQPKEIIINGGHFTETNTP